MASRTNVPLCPLTGQPAIRQVQWVSARLLRDLWQFVFRIDAREALLGVDLFGLWESPAGLYFFDPPRPGNQEFYDQFYARIASLGLFSQNHIRGEFTMAARSIPPGARVLDVGCGLGNFRACLPHANYTGLDPHTGARAGAAEIRGETLAAHLAGYAAAYDAVCAFQVLEHVPKPAELFAEMVQAAKPGGLIFAGVPHVQSPAARIPNYIINAPPHHLTWWTEAALAELARGAGATVEAIEHVPWGRSDALIYWIERCTFIKCDKEHYRGHWSWHASAALGVIAGLIVSRLAGVPSGGGEGSGLLLTARRAQ